MTLSTGNQKWRYYSLHTIEYTCLVYLYYARNFRMSARKEKICQQVEPSARPQKEVMMPSTWLEASVHVSDCIQTIILGRLSISHSRPFSRHNELVFCLKTSCYIKILRIKERELAIWSQNLF